MRTYHKGRGVHVTDADVEKLIARGFTIRDSWKPPPVTTEGLSSARHRSGFRADLGLYQRSAWEANYSRILNYRQARGEILEWEYEPYEFGFPVKRGAGKFYKPDFRVWIREARHYWVELKGHMTPASATKLKRMQKYYPEEQVILIREAEYRALERQYAPLLPAWEYDR